MRGGHLHNQIILGLLMKECTRLSIPTRSEVKVSDGNRIGYFDLVLDIEGYLIAVEAELTSKRVMNDVWKAEVSGIDELWILIPNKQLEKSIVRKLNQHPLKSKPCPIYVFTLGLAIQELRNRFLLISSPNPIQKTKIKRRKS